MTLKEFLLVQQVLEELLLERGFSKKGLRCWLNLSHRQLEKILQAKHHIVPMRQHQVYHLFKIHQRFKSYDLAKYYEAKFKLKTGSKD